MAVPIGPLAPYRAIFMKQLLEVVECFETITKGN
jgi:hypothetical protein